MLYHLTNSGSTWRTARTGQVPPASGKLTAPRVKSSPRGVNPRRQGARARTGRARHGHMVSVKN
eukprot:4062646-Pyramimonas_sp.AAC.1